MSTPPLRPLRISWRSSDPLGVRWDPSERTEGDVVGFVTTPVHGPCAVVLVGDRLVQAPLYADVVVVGRPG